ncbi:hypothetical protein AXF42_Ash000779 [Apostasia shenzhenica]|uniref:G domain-containing protein n=1 Tax=Apostasia shenzhenica TaxID=1088818 RepID=A0A2I0AHA8_9ASPA|nr:hypothetical protein AXF42_Ash000779 [Apostasia shenzhenica]
MRGTVQPLRCDGGGGDGEGDFEAEDFFWWRSLPEFDGTGVGTTKAGKVKAATARKRVVREMERLAAAAAESLDEVRHRLLTYRPGDLWVPAGGLAKQDTDIPRVITLLLLGFTGVGKSSLVNLMYSVLGRSCFVPFAQSSSQADKDGHALCLEEHNVLRSMKNGFCVFDSPGLDYDRISDGLDEVSEWMEQGVRHRQPCRGYSSSSSPSTSYSTAPASATANCFMHRRVNCAIVVAGLSELHKSLISGHLQPLDATRQLFHHPSIRETCSESLSRISSNSLMAKSSSSSSSTDDGPILVLTHGDELTAEERIKTRVTVCEYLGLPETAGVYDVPTVNEFSGWYANEFDPVTGYAVAEMIYRALVVADRSHPPKSGMKECLLAVISWVMCTLAAFFAFLSCCCSKLAKMNRDHQKTR